MEFSNYLWKSIIYVGTFEFLSNIIIPSLKNKKITCGVRESPAKIYAFFTTNMYRHMHQPHVKLGINHNIGLNVLLIKSVFYILYLIKQSKKS